MSIADNVLKVQERIDRAARRVGRRAEDITLVVIAKTTDACGVRQAFAAGLRHFGENRVQEAERKIKELLDLRSQTVWHMVGNLQRNKAKASTQAFDIIQSVATVGLAERLDRLLDRRMPIFLEVNVSGEAAKQGFSPAELAAAYSRLRDLDHLDIRGLMTIAPLGAALEEARPFFRRLRELARALAVPELSMGMTNDFEVAIEEGATVLRIGRGILNG